MPGIKNTINKVNQVNNVVEKGKDDKVKEFLSGKLELQREQLKDLETSLDEASKIEELILKNKIWLLEEIV